MTKLFPFHMGNLMPKAETQSKNCHFLSQNEKDVLTSMYHLQRRRTQNRLQMMHYLGSLSISGSNEVLYGAILFVW